MKTLMIATLAVALFAVPAMAQQTPPTGPPPDSQMHAQYDAMHKQMMQIHRDARMQMLAAITPAHRQLLSTIAGQLAVAPNPDYDAAAKQLDSALSASEKQAIENASTSMRAAMQSMHPSMHSMHSPMPGESGTMGGGMMGGGMMGGGMMGSGMMGAHEPKTPGATLLHMALGFDAMTFLR